MPAEFNRSRSPINSPRQRRSGRTGRPTTKAREIDLVESHDEDEAVALDELLGTVGEVRELTMMLGNEHRLHREETQALKSEIAITQQNAREEVQQLRQELTALHSENTNIRKELDLARDELKATGALISSDLATIKSLVSNPTSTPTTSATARTTGGLTPRSYASIVGTSANTLCSTGQYSTRTANGSNDHKTKSRALPGMTIDTRRMKDRSRIAPENAADMEKQITAAIKAGDETQDVQITGIQIRGHNVREQPPKEKQHFSERTTDG